MAENKHTNYDLAQMQSLPLSAKISMTKNRIRAWYEHFDGNVYVSISGGKDSQVLAHIVKSMYKDVPLVFVNTGLEFDSVREKAISMADEVLKPSMDFVNVIKKYGYPIISKEVSECVDQARKYLTKEYVRQALTDRQTDRQTDRPYYYRYRKICGIGEYANKGSKSDGNADKGQQSDGEYP